MVLVEGAAAVTGGSGIAAIEGSGWRFHCTPQASATASSTCATIATGSPFHTTEGDGGGSRSEFSMAGSIVVRSLLSRTTIALRNGTRGRAHTLAPK